LAVAPFADIAFRFQLAAGNQSGDPDTIILASAPLGRIPQPSRMSKLPPITRATFRQRMSQKDRSN
jgi:hypothetical protein